MVTKNDKLIFMSSKIKLNNGRFGNSTIYKNFKVSPWSFDVPVVAFINI